MKRSESIKAIMGALLCFNSECEKIGKDSTNPFFKSNYASLSNIQDSIRLPLLNAKLVINQFPEGENSLTTLITHVDSGEWLESTFEMNPVKPDPQAKGSSITYARRYALASILGLNVDDDDGNKGSVKQKSLKTPTKVTKKHQVVEKLTQDAVKKWRGGGLSKTNGKNTIYIEGVEYWLTPDQVEWVKAHKLYKEIK